MSKSTLLPVPVLHATLHTEMRPVLGLSTSGIATTAQPGGNDAATPRLQSRG